MHRTDKLEALGAALQVLDFATAETRKRAPHLQHPLLCLDAIRVGVEQGGRAGIVAVCAVQESLCTNHQSSAECTMTMDASLMLLMQSEPSCLLFAATTSLFWSPVKWQCARRSCSTRKANGAICCNSCQFYVRGLIGRWTICSSVLSVAEN